MRLIGFLLFLLLLPALFMLAYQNGLLEGLVSDTDIPDEPFIQAELAQKTDGPDLSRRINAALADGNYDDAVMYEDLAAYMDLPLDPATSARLTTEKTLPRTVARNTGNFFEGFITGTGSDTASFAGALTSDLTVIGDVRDIGTEGSKLVKGEDYSKLILGLSVVGLAATTATVATGGGGLPARVGVSILKASEKAGTLTVRFTKDISRITSEAVNFPELKNTLKGVDLADIPATRHAITDYAKSISMTRVTPVLNDVASLEENVGPAETVRLMKYVDGTEDLANVTKMTGKLGTKTRGIIEITGKTSLRAFKTAANLVFFAFKYVWAIGAAFTLALFRAFTRGSSQRRQRQRSSRFTR